MNSKKCHSKFIVQNIIISNAKVIKKNKPATDGNS